jgi:hypothetical protein
MQKVVMIEAKSTSTHSATLEKVHCQLRTALGDSMTIYQHTESTPIHGTAQGSCANLATD